MARLTKRVVDALVPREREYVVWDDELKGFGCRVQPSGKKTFTTLYRAGGGRAGKLRRFTIGEHGKLTADEARQEARRILALAATGHDPQGQRSAKRREATIGDLCDRFLNEHVSIRLKPSTQAEVRRHVETRIRPAFGRLKVTDLTRATVRAWHNGMAAKPYEANRSLAYLSKMMSLAVDVWELVPANPCQGVERFPEQKRDRFFNAEELGRLGAALEDMEAKGEAPPGHALAIRLLALTGMRLSEVLGLQWPHVDLAAGIVRLPDAKAGARTVTLGAPTVAILASLARDTGPVCQYLGTDQPITKSSLERFWRALRDRAGLPDGRIHDLRHTTGTYAGMAGHNAFLVRDLLGHKTLAMTGRYVSRDTDPLRAAADLVSGRIAAAMSGKPPANVMPLRERGR